MTLENAIQGVRAQARQTSMLGFPYACTGCLGQKQFPLTVADVQAGLERLYGWHVSRSAISACIRQKDVL